MEVPVPVPVHIFDFYAYYGKIKLNHLGKRTFLETQANNYQ